MTDDVRVSTEIQVDNETRAALLLFNERVEATAADARAAKRVAKAERAKDDAAGVVRKLADDSSASPEAKAEAEEAYKAAVEELQVILANPHAETPKAPTAPAEDAAPAEVSADEQPPAETAAESPAESE